MWLRHSKIDAYQLRQKRPFPNCRHIFSKRNGNFNVQQSLLSDISRKEAA